jgi:hypothetical protein
MRTATILLAATVIGGAAVPAAQAQTGAPLLLAQATPSTPQPATKLTGMAAWSALLGNTVVGKLEGKDFADYYLADGTVKSIVEDKAVAGKWSLEGDKICFTYPDEPKDCYIMEVVGDSATFTDKSGLAVKVQILKGNAKNL